MQIQNFSFHLDRPWRITMILQRKLWKTCLLAGNVEDKTNPGAFFYFHREYMKWITNWPIFADLVAQKKWVVLWAFWSPMRWSNCSLRYGAVWILFFLTIWSRWKPNKHLFRLPILLGRQLYWREGWTPGCDFTRVIALAKSETLKMVLKYKTADIVWELFQRFVLRKGLGCQWKI